MGHNINKYHENIGQQLLTSITRLNDFKIKIAFINAYHIGPYQTHRAMLLHSTGGVKKCPILHQNYNAD